MIIEIKKTDYPILMDIWGSAVLNTHDFLKQEDFCITKSIFLPIFSMLPCMDVNKTAVWLDL